MCSSALAGYTHPKEPPLAGYSHPFSIRELRTTVVILATALILGCTTTLARKPDLPQCYVQGLRGVWICEVGVIDKACVCASRDKFNDWVVRSGL
jgi:hypothetical protein